MKVNIYRTLLLTVLFICLRAFIYAQAGLYVFSSSAGTYTPISGGTVLGVSSNDDDNFNQLPIGFRFWFNNQPFQTFSVNANGFLAFGNSVGSSYQPISLGPNNFVVSALGANLQGEAGTGELRYELTGTAPNRVLVVQWSNYDLAPSNANTCNLNFQIRLSESSNQIQYVYGNTVFTSASAFFEVGLRGNANLDFNNRQVQNNINTWATSVPGGGNSAACEMNNTLTPASGQTFTWNAPSVPAVPINISFTAVTTSAMTVNWVDNSTDELVFYVERSTDNINFSPVGTVLSTSTAGTGTAYSLAQTGLFSNTLYYFRVYAMVVTPAAALTGQQATLNGTLCGTFTVGPSGTYTSLTSAFTALGTNGVSCPVILELQTNYVSTVETFPITVPFLANSTLNTITVRPITGATNLSISSNGLQTINLNGAHNIIFDGRPGGTGTTRELTIANTSTTGSAIQVIGDAQNCTLNYITLRGVCTGSRGVVQYLTPVTTAGSSGHSISNCEFAPGATTPQNMIYSSSATVDGFITVSVTNNLIHDWHNGSNTAAIQVLGYGRNWNISGNSFYQSVSRSLGNGLQYVIQIGTTALGTGGNTISGNFIGGTAPNCGGSAYTITSSSSARFVAISAGGNSTGNPIPTSIQGNTITNINFTTQSGTGTAPGIFSAIHSSGTFHNVNVGNVTGNIIGSVSTANAIVTSSAVGSGALTAGISCIGTGAVNISNNQIGGITCNSPIAIGSTNFTGIFNSGVPNAVINNNLIGSLTLANSVQTAISTGTTSGIVMGIHNTGNGQITINNNVVSNLFNRYSGTATGSSTRGIFSSNGTNIISNNTVNNLTTLSQSGGSNTSASMQGITVSSSLAAVQEITGNSITSLSNIGTAAGVRVVGIGLTTGAATNPVCRIRNNTIAGLGAVSNTQNQLITGIQLFGSPAQVFNNFVNLGTDATGNAITAPISFTGINKETSANCAVNFNTVQISGSGISSGAINTYAFRRILSGIDTLSGNILVNQRSNTTATGLHIAVSLNDSNSLTINYNNYFGTGSGYTLAEVNTVSYTSINTFIGAIGGNANSFTVNPNFVSSTNLHINTALVSPLESTGPAVGYVVNDIDLQTRPGPTGSVNGGGTARDIGADEFDGIPLTTDIGAFAILAPSTTGCYTNAETIRVRVKNYSSTAINLSAPGNGLIVSVTVTGVNPQTYSVGPITTGVIPGGGFLDTAVTVSYNMTAAGNHIFTANATTTGEILVTNDAFGPVTIHISGGSAIAGGLNGRSCFGSPTTVNVSGYTNNGTVQWESSPDGITWTPIPLATSAQLVTTPTDTTLYRALICGLHYSSIDTIFPIVTAPPVISGNTTRCGPGTVNLSGTASGTLNWYTQPTGGTPVATGNSFSPFVAASTNFYAENATGTPPTSQNTTYSAGTSAAGSMFVISALTNLTITGFDAHMTTGTANWQIWGRTGRYDQIPGANISSVGWTLLAAVNNVPAAGLGIPTPLPATLSVTIPAGNDYSFYVVCTTPGLFQNYSIGPATYTAFTTTSDFIFRSGNGGSYFNATINNRVWNGTIHYYSGCASFPRTTIPVTVTPTPAITSSASANVFCGADSVQLNVTSSNPGYNYTWQPAAGLNTTIGSSVIAHPAIITDYIVSALDISTGCATSDTVRVIPALDVNISAAVSDDTICVGSQVQLDVIPVPEFFTVGTGNAQNTVNTYPAPFGTTQSGSRHQMLIPAAELAASGMTRGYYNSLGFELPPGANTPPPAFPIQNFQIKIANTSLNSLNVNFQTSGFSTYLNPTTISPTVGVYTINFSSPWFWDGESNIIVETCFNGSSVTDNWIFRQTSTPYVSVIEFSSIVNSQPCTVAVAANTYNQRPNMIFGRSDAGFTYQWSLSPVSNSTIQNPTATPAASNLFAVLVTDSISGCQDTDTVSVFAGTIPSVNFGGDTLICSAAPLLLAGPVGPYDYLWQDNSTTPTYAAGSFGTYSLLVTDTLTGCFSGDTILIGVNPSPVFTLGADVSLCTGSSAVFSGPLGNYTYNWSTSSNTSATETVNVSGVVILTVTDTVLGCPGFDTVVVTFNQPPQISLGNDTTLCASETPYTIIAPPGSFTYQWQDNSTGPQFIALTSGIYSITVTDTTTLCTDSDTLILNVNTNPVVGLGNDTVLCSNNTPLVLAGPGGNFSYVWQDNSALSTYAVNASGLYSLTATDNTTGCAGADSILITVNTSPNFSLGNDTTLCGTSLLINGPSGNYSYSWTPASQTQNYTATASGPVSLTVTDNTNNCTASDQIVITLNAPPVVSSGILFDTTCTSDGIRTLTGIPSGGIWSGPGVAANNFSASTAGIGTHVLTYVFTDINGCTGSVTDTVITDACIGIETISLLNNLNVYPNPASGVVYISVSGITGQAFFELVDMRGRTVSSSSQIITDPASVSEIDISKFENGIYFLRININGESGVVKVLKAE
ncbi:MAG: T9SS type A sorting domain-containing protein [Bacteroidia bacterium]|jgi:hypothetical protein|nr:T9SS type A sorting domain-containing protein [Bacteroidia bacterium]